MNTIPPDQHDLILWIRRTRRILAILSVAVLLLAWTTYRLVDRVNELSNQYNAEAR